jgi:hypothetical protein
MSEYSTPSMDAGVTSTDMPRALDIALTIRYLPAKSLHLVRRRTGADNSAHGGFQTSGIFHDQQLVVRSKIHV